VIRLERGSCFIAMVGLGATIHVFADVSKGAT